MEGKATELEQVKRLSHVVLNFQILASIWLLTCKYEEQTAGFIDSFFQQLSVVHYTLFKVFSAVHNNVNIFPIR